MNAKQKLIQKINKTCDNCTERAKNIAVSGNDPDMIACETAAAIKEMAAILKEALNFLLKE